MSEESIVTTNYDENLTIAELVPSRNLTLTSGDGRQATIDFMGEAVTYSGELPVSEAAKIFFDCVFSHFKKGE